MKREGSYKVTYEQLIQHNTNDTQAMYNTLCGQFTEYCLCGKSHVLTTQQDKDPEYYACVMVKCSCGKQVPFKLPVN